MATNFLWGTTSSVQNLLTTEMNSLAISTLTTVGPEINNTNGPQLGQLTLTLASAAFVAGNYASVYFLPSNNTAGGSYPTLGTFAQEALSNYLAGVMYIKGTTAAQLSLLQYVLIPSGKFKTFLATGGSCPTLASSGNTLDLYQTPTQY
jgi:hypothetical protein